MANLHSCICLPINTNPGLSGIDANRIYLEIVPSTKISKLRAVKGKENSPWGGSRKVASHPEEETKSQTYEEQFQRNGSQSELEEFRWQ